MYVVYEIASGRVISSHSKEPIADSGYAVIFKQDYNPTQDVYYNPELGSFAGMSDAEQDDVDMQSLRSQRDKWLIQCDWTQAADSPLSDAKKAEWATYRQQLRDLPANTSDPANPTWPTPPS